MFPFHANILPFAVKYQSKLCISLTYSYICHRIAEKRVFSARKWIILTKKQIKL